MRRIYESDALSRDDDTHFVPAETGETYEPQSFRSLDASAWSDRLLPHALRCRAIGLQISAPQTGFERGEAIPFIVTMKNSLPIPISIRTESPLLWNWSVGGHEEASQVRLREPPADGGSFHFRRGERKRFRKQWSQKFRVADREWRHAEPGAYTIRAAINVTDPDAAGLTAETTVRIEA